MSRPPEPNAVLPLSVVVLSCGRLGVEVSNRLSRLDAVKRVTLVSTPYRTRKRRGLDKVRHVVRHDGTWGAFTAAVRRAGRLLLPRRTASTGRDGPAGLEGLLPEVEHHHFTDFHSAECVEKLRALRPDLGVLAGVYILRESVFEVPRLGSINLHAGKVPEYRGSAPAFWEMYNGEGEVGITVHRVTVDLDAGAVVRQEVFPLDPAPPGDPLEYIERYRSEVLEPNGIRMLAESVRDIALGRSADTAQDSTVARTYRTPRHADTRELRRRVDRRRSGTGTVQRDPVGWKKVVKIALGWTVFRTGLYRLWFRDRAMILLFHRVEEETRGNPLSCSSPSFDAFCRFFKRYFDVIPLSELLDRLESSASLDRRLVITFDDGYLDNRETAAPILRSHGLSACFFITTDLMETDHVAWWDEAIGIDSPWMKWSDVRSLAEMGFEVASHTRTHVDLGIVDGDEAREEIEGSGRRLEIELGREVPLFSYPFGRRENVTPANRRLVEAAGFRCCCSAYGGDVRPDSNPFDLRRLPVDEGHISPYQLGFELLYERLPVVSPSPGDPAESPRPDPRSNSPQRHEPD